MQRFDDLLPVGIIARVATFASLTLACTGPTPAPDVPPPCTCEDQCNGGRACVLLDPRACSCRDGGVDIPAADTPSTDASMDATARDVEAPEVSPPPRGCEPPCARGNCCAGACVDLASPRLLEGGGEPPVHASDGAGQAREKTRRRGGAFLSKRFDGNFRHASALCRLRGAPNSPPLFARVHPCYRGALRRAAANFGFSRPSVAAAPRADCRPVQGRP